MTVNTITVGPGTLTLGETGSLKQFNSQLTSCRVVPSVDNGDPIDVLSGEQAPGDRSESFTLSGTLLQDLGTVDGTAEYTWTNRGVQMPFVYVPNTAKGKQISGQVVVEAIELGGDAKTKPTSDFEWQIIGAPEITDVAAP